MLKAVFPGSFDPPTLVHLNIIERASSIFDELIVVVAENRRKNNLFSANERVELIRDLVSEFKNVSVAICDSLIVEFMDERDVSILVRGVRGVEDFSYEFELSMLNKALNRQIETLFMTTDPEYFVLRSSSIKELASFHGNVSGMVPAVVEKALKEKFRG
jgi:pantetheine-phosphate adenylyltransferase